MAEETVKVLVLENTRDPETYYAYERGEYEVPVSVAERMASRGQVEFLDRDSLEQKSADEVKELAAAQGVDTSGKTKKDLVKEVAQK